MRVNEIPAPRVLLIRRRYLGDVLLLSPVTAALRAKWPDARITVGCEERYAQAADLLPGVDDVLEIPGGWRGWRSVVSRLVRGRFTHVMDYDNRRRTALVAGLSGAANRVAFPIGRAKRIARFCYTRILEMPGDVYARQHMSENYAWAWKETGHELPASRHSLVVPDLYRKDAREKIAGSSWAQGEIRNRLIVHVGTRSAARRWPVENFAAALRKLESENALRPAIVGGPGDEATLEALKRLLPNVLSFGSVTDVRALAALMAQASLFIGHDSGPAHLAAGLGLKIVTLAIAPELTQWKPLANDVRVIAAPNPCPGCLAPGSCVPGDSYRMCCVRHISVDQLITEVRALFA